MSPTRDELRTVWNLTDKGWKWINEDRAERGLPPLIPRQWSAEPVEHR